MRRSRNAALAAVTTLVATGLVLTGGPVEARVVVKTRAGEVSRPVDGTAVMELPFAAGHVALRWVGNPEAEVTVATATDGVDFGPATDAGRDEVGEHRRNGETYGAVLPAGGATAVRIDADRPLGRVTVLALADGERVTTTRALGGRPAGASASQPPIRSRSDWGADESLRFDTAGNEVWPPTFHPVQKLVVHHTATANADANPPATIRSIYYYHSVTQGWGDIGYNFVVDEAGNVYKGRHSHTTAGPDDTLTGEDSAGNGVTAAHAYGFNSGTVGVALLGTLTRRDATSAARNALVDFLAWKADAHAISATGSSLYTNPSNGSTATFPNIAGHRDLNATECPGDSFYATLPSVRSDVAARVSGVTTTSSSTTTTIKKKGGPRR